jgi:hypothetical protein
MKYKNINFINDKKIFNLRYRKGLKEALTKKNLLTNDIGIFDSNIPILLPFISLLFGRDKFNLSSNIKANIISLIMFKRRGVVILNGLGRYRNNKFFRRLLLLLFSLNNNKLIISQSYADYRYIRKYLSQTRLEWVCGSGGESRTKTHKKGLFIIQRDNKIKQVIDDVCNALLSIKYNQEFTIIGCNNSEEIIQKLSSTEACIESIGFVNQEDIFLYGNKFLQPSGYGEGFPHTLADAICSDVEILINKKEFIKYGLYRKIQIYENVHKNWISFKPCTSVKNFLNKDTINEKYASIISKFFHEDNKF